MRYPESPEHTGSRIAQLRFGKLGLGFWDDKRELKMGLSE
jgi:hypothetical protein